MKPLDFTPIVAIPHVALTAICHVLGVEGGNVNNVNDIGGKTNFGISDLRDGKEDGLIDLNLDGIGDIDPEDLTREQAIQIFYRDYWQANGCERIYTPIGLLVFDIAVNQSAVFARKTLQKLLGVKVDGIIGQQTAKALCGAELLPLTLQLTLARLQRYRERVADNPSQQIFFKGWINRAFHVLNIAQGEICYGADY